MLCFPSVHGWLLMLPGVTPPSVLAKLPLWYFYVALLAIVTIMKLLTLDVAGTLIQCLMLFVAWLIVRDRMQDAPKYIVGYTILCILEFIFDVVPLILSIGGRSSITVEPGYATSYEGIEQTTYTRTVHNTSFFDPRQSLLYNVKGATMITSSVCMSLGIYLSCRAQCAIQMAAGEQIRHDQEHGDGATAPPSGANQERSPQARPRTQSDYSQFFGTGHKLSP